MERVRSFVRDEVLPVTREWERNVAFPDEIWLRLGSLGLLGMTLPAAKGGSGLSCLAYCLAIKEVAKGDPALAMNLSAINALCVAHFDRFSTPEQCDKYLPGIVSGRDQVGLGPHRTGRGLGCQASENGCGSYRRPPWILSPEWPEDLHHKRRQGGPYRARRADLRVGTERLLMETDHPGFQLERRIPTVGVCASNTVQFRLDDAVGWHTPCTFEQAISLLYRGRLGIAGMAAGIAEKALELSVEYAKQREQFNRRLADMQSVQNMIADSAMEVEASNLLLENGARLSMPVRPP